MDQHPHLARKADTIAEVWVGEMSSSKRLGPGLILAQ